MSLWRQITRGVRGLLRGDEKFRDATDEVEDYVEQAAAEYRSRGLSPEEARRAARLDVGSLAGAADAVRSHGWESLVEALFTDLRYAARRLRAEPGFTAVTVLTLALGIGASTAIMSAVRPVLFESLPYPDADRIMAVWDLGADGDRVEVTFNTHQELRARAGAFEALAVYLPWQPTLTGPAEPERLEGQRVTWEYFRALGVSPALGLDFEAADDRPGGAGPVILSDGLWRRRFGADPAIIGQLVTLSGNSHVVSGVMPAGFENLPWPAAELWTPLQYESTEGRAWGHHLRMIGRVRPGINEAAAGRELAAIAGNPVPEFPRVPWAALDQGLLVTSLQADLTRGVRPALLAILGAVALVLVIACVNVANLLLARGARRQREFALRATLGAGAGRLVRQALTESLFLAALGGAAGVVVAMIGVRALVALSPPGLPRVSAIGLDGPVLFFALAVTVLVGVVLGVVPARAAMCDTRHDGTRYATARHRATRSALIVTQVAMALVLLVCSGLLLRSMQRLLAVEPGFAPDRLLTMQVQVSGERFSEAGTVERFFAEARGAVEQVPGVAAAALTSQLPLSDDFNQYGVHPEPSLRDDPGEERGTFRYAVSPGYFETMGIPLRRGRPLEASDRAETVPVVVVSESFARRRLAGVEPLGYQLRIGGSDRVYHIVGIAGNVRQVSLALSETDAVYVTSEQWPGTDPVMSLVVRARGDALALAQPVRRAIWSVDKDQPVVRITTMEQLVADSAAERRFALLIFQAFALAALVLAAAGLYGVLAGSVTERTREIGVRAALGASPRSILALVVRQGMTLTGFGAVIGLAGAMAATRALATMLFGISPLDPVTYLAVIALLAAVAALACMAPAWRAARVSPASPLRAE